jgi:succinate dehydrogenase/fumarate reductase cytochrome b subunit
MPDPAASPPPFLTWEADVPLLTNRFFLYDAAKVMIGSVLVFTLLLVALTGGDGNRERLIALLELIGACFAFVVALLIVVVLAVFRNRYRVRYLVSEAGIGYETVDPRGQAGSALAVVAGLLAANPGVAGAGLLSASRRAGLIEWTRVRRVKAYREERAISVMNSWRVTARLFFHGQEGAFDQALAWIERCAGPEVKQ